MKLYNLRYQENSRCCLEDYKFFRRETSFSLPIYLLSLFLARRIEYSSVKNYMAWTLRITIDTLYYYKGSSCPYSHALLSTTARCSLCPVLTPCRNANRERWEHRA